MRHTRDTIAEILRKNDRAVERAMVVLYDRQTHDEKSSSDTRHNNTVGFSGAHASKGSYYARWVLGGKHLTGHHLENARRIALKYTRQLLQEAELKAKPDAVGLAKRNDQGRSRDEQIRHYMRQSRSSRKDAERVIDNVMAGKCPDGCCGGVDEHVEREMHRIEAEGDWEQTKREELAKMQAKEDMERSAVCLRKAQEVGIRAHGRGGHVYVPCVCEWCEREKVL